MRDFKDAADNPVGEIGEEKPQDAVTVLNCTYSDLSQPGAEQKHQDAARRAYSYFKSQDYTGPMVMVMVDSSSKPNPEMVEKSDADEDFYYLHIPDRDNVCEVMTQTFPDAVAKIPDSGFFETDQFAGTLAVIQNTIDDGASNPLNQDNNRPPLGSKRNCAIEASKAIFADRGTVSDVIVYFDDDIYRPKYVSNAVANLQDGHVFTAEVSYYVALPKADLDNPGEFDVETGTYLFGEEADKFTWLNTLGHELEGNEGQILSKLPFGFTYAVRTEAWEEVGGIADILRGEDRSLLIPIIEKYGMSALNLRTELSGDLVRLLGDNNSHNAISKDDTPFPEDLMPEVQEIFAAWREMLTNKYQTLLKEQTVAPEPAQPALMAAVNG